MAWRPTPSPLHARLLDTCSLTVLAFSALSSFPDRPLERAWAWGGILRSTRSVLFESRLEPFQVASEAEAEAGDLRNRRGRSAKCAECAPSLGRVASGSGQSCRELRSLGGLGLQLCPQAVPSAQQQCLRRRSVCVPELLDVHPCISPSICITV